MGRGSNNTRRMLAAAAALVCTVLVIAAPARAEAVCEEVQGDWRGISAAPMSSQHPRYVHVCRGVKGWRAVPFLWAPLRVSINCSSSSVRRCCYRCVPGGGADGSVRVSVKQCPVLALQRPHMHGRPSETAPLLPRSILSLLRLAWRS
jgi:hypothetical protein